MAQRRVVVQEEAEHGDEHEEQREQREKAVVRDQGGEVPAPVVAVLLDHADDERRRPVTPLPLVGPLDRAVDHLHARCGSRRSRRATTLRHSLCSNARAASAIDGAIAGPVSITSWWSTPLQAKGGS